MMGGVKVHRFIGAVAATATLTACTGTGGTQLSVRATQAAGQSSSASSSAAGTGPTVTASDPVTTAGLTPIEAMARLRQLRGTSPILVPVIPSSWTTTLTVDATHGYLNVVYTAPSGNKSATVSIEIVGSLPISPRMTHRSPHYRGDAEALYQIDDSALPASGREVVWTEPGQWVGASDPATPPSWRSGGIPYVLSAQGLTEDEFWAVANSLHGVTASD